MKIDELLVLEYSPTELDSPLSTEIVVFPSFTLYNLSIDFKQFSRVGNENNDFRPVQSSKYKGYLWQTKPFWL
jgi:hypothetical protein